MFAPFTFCKHSLNLAVNSSSCGFSSSMTKRKKHMANEKRHFNQKAREINLFSPCDSALTVLTSETINLSKFIEASEQRLQSHYFSDTPRIINQFPFHCGQATLPPSTFSQINDIHLV